MLTDAEIDALLQFAEDFSRAVVRDEQPGNTIEDACDLIRKREAIKEYVKEMIERNNATRQ